MGEERKLKRGLKDISPLFRAMSGDMPPEDGAAPLAVLSVHSPDRTAGSFTLCTVLASRLASARRPCHILSVDGPGCNGSPARDIRRITSEAINSHLRRYELSWGEFEGLSRESALPASGGIIPKQLIFMDVDYEDVPRSGQVLGILDKLILVVRPEVDSLSEAYRFIKFTLTLTHGLEYYLVFGTERGGQDIGAFLFERFASILSTRLGVHLVWLGTLGVRPGDDVLAEDLVLEHLFLRERNFVDSPSKIAFSRWTDQFSERFVVLPTP